MNGFIVSIIVSYLAVSFGEDLMILPNLKQHWVIKGSTINITCIHNGTQSSQHYALSFWKSNSKLVSGNGVTIHNITVADTQDATRVIRRLVLTKSDVQFNDGVTYKCILGHNLSNILAEAVIEVRVLQKRKRLILSCNASGMNQSDTSFTVTTEWVLVLDGKEWFLQNSSKYTIFTANRTLEISYPVRQDAGEYRCILVFNKGNKLSEQKVHSPPINVYAYPNIETHDINKNLVPGDILKLQCTASGFPRPNITWKKDGKSLNQTNRIYPKEERLLIYIVEFNDTGEYECVASHSLLPQYDSAKMFVNITDAKSGGRGHMQDFPWIYVFFLLCLLHCGLYSQNYNSSQKELARTQERPRP
ncbi:hypothetical protein CHS0354_024837 [Potamilus streckersoni]|uniref:Ig-like domain-containing protein n=1 Tax=Potamilus streckersoni TaxID=2493646 RepID=A0AAE0SZN8_9BIVA|nr:hypothetical protein CHS0354_024837 [Potamilus streckersoni]